MPKPLLCCCWLAACLLLAVLPALALSPGLSLQGHLLDARTGAPLPYASIGLAGQPVGTMTDLQGAFRLSLQPDQLNRNLRFSTVGYLAREIQVADLLEQQASQGKLTIRLTAQPKSLAEVQVKAGQKRYRSQQVGSQIGKLTPFRHHFDTYTYAPDQVKGPELGVRIRARKYPAYLERLHFCLSGTGADITRVRLKLYSLRQNLPYTDILPQVIQLDVPPRYTGWIETDLSRYNLRLDEDFVVALEWLQEENETEKSWLASGMVFSPPHPDYYKPANQDQWKMLRNESVGLYVTLLY
ncbi:MAG: carboxypeptidase-like regulatory domain-containing protein [Adhaeribacter sp.]